MKKKFLTLLFCLFVATLLNAQVQGFELLNKKVLQYEKAEWNIQLIAEWQNPYLQEDIALDMLLTSPSGKKIILPCYYESGESGKPSKWKARFAAQETGNYTYSFQLTKANEIVSNSAQSSFQSNASVKNGFLHTKNNWVLEFDNGKAFRGIGENICWESRANDDSKFFKELHEKEKYNYEYMLPSLAKHGGNFYRTWISSWNLPIDWKKGFNSKRYTASDEYYNPSAVKALDRLVTLSDSLGLYIMLTLGTGASDVRSGGFATSSADFFVNPLAKQKYKNRLRYIIARWGYSTSIATWEFFNEVDNVQFSNRNAPISAASITDWHAEMSTYLKSIDLYKHIVTTSISHRDVKGMNDLPNIDINQKHIYKNTKVIPSTIVKYEEDYKKPYVIGEYGYEYDWQKNFNLFANEMDSDFKRGMWYGLFSSTPILPMSWWWEYFDDRGTDVYLNRIKIISEEMLAAGKGSFEKVNAKTTDSATEIFAVACGNKVFVYAYNHSATDKKVSLQIPLKSPAELSYKIFDCEPGVYSKAKKIKVTSADMKLRKILLHANADVVLIISKAE
jgi:hypothetical protein